MNQYVGYLINQVPILSYFLNYQETGKIKKKKKEVWTFKQMLCGLYTLTLPK